METVCKAVGRDKEETLDCIESLRAAGQWRAQVTTRACRTQAPLRRLIIVLKALKGTAPQYLRVWASQPPPDVDGWAGPRCQLQCSSLVRARVPQSDPDLGERLARARLQP